MWEHSAVGTSGISICGATDAVAPGPRRCQGPMKEEKKQQKNSCPELPQALFLWMKYLKCISVIVYL